MLLLLLLLPHAVPTLLQSAAALLVPLPQWSAWPMRVACSQLINMASAKIR